ncbi:MAG: hypothetical protein ACLFP2_01420 [Candidatus Woesearchaeota archaeon]
MRGIDNSEYLIRSVEETKEREIRKIRLSYELEIERFKAEQERLIESEIKALEKKHLDEKERLKRQHDSQNDLWEQRSRITMHSEYLKAIRDEVFLILDSNPSLVRIVVSNLMQRVKDQGGIKKFYTPKGSGIGHDVLETFTVRGVVDENEEYEDTLELSDGFIQQVIYLE